MDTLDGSENANISPTSPNSTTFGVQFSPLRFFQSPVSTLLEYSGLLRVRPDNPETEPLVADNNNSNVSGDINSSSSGEVSIRITEGEDSGEGEGSGSVEEREGSGVDASTVPTGSAEDDIGSNNRDSTYQRFDIQQVARWIEQILPFSLLLLFVFIRQHLQGFFVTIWITAFMFKSNDILRKQTALKGERNIDVLVGYFVVFVIHVIGVYWWYRNDDLFYPLLMVPPKVIPPFWHAIFMILVNGKIILYCFEGIVQKGSPLWVSCHTGAGKCCWRSVRYLPGEDACTNFVAMQTHLL